MLSNPGWMMRHTESSILGSSSHRNTFEGLNSDAITVGEEAAGRVSHGTKMNALIRPASAMLACSQNITRQCVNVTMMPPTKGPDYYQRTSNRLLGAVTYQLQDPRSFPPSGSQLQCPCEASLKVSRSLSKIIAVLTASKLSATIACPATRKKHDSNPDSIRMTTKVLIVCAKAAPIENKANASAASRYDTLRPISFMLSVAISYMEGNLFYSAQGVPDERGKCHGKDQACVCIIDRLGRGVEFFRDLCIRRKQCSTGKGSG